MIDSTDSFIGAAVIVSTAVATFLGKVGYDRRKNNRSQQPTNGERDLWDRRKNSSSAKRFETVDTAITEIKGDTKRNAEDIAEIKVDMKKMVKHDHDTGLAVAELTGYVKASLEKRP